MASGAEAETGVPSEHVLEWVQKDEEILACCVPCWWFGAHHKVCSIWTTVILLVINFSFWCSYLAYMIYLPELIYPFLTAQYLILSALGWSSWGNRIFQKRNIPMHSLVLDLKILVVGLTYRTPPSLCQACSITFSIQLCVVVVFWKFW